MNIIKIDSWYDTDNTVITGFSYVYDTLGRISEETHLDKNEKMCYTYDVLNRVTARTVKNATTDAVISTETFTYDAAGNITGGSANATFVYDTNNRLVTYNGNAVSYDLDGNMLSNGSMTCTYDLANRLLTAGGNTYTYNAEDVRIKNVHYGVEEKYTYDTNCKLSKMLTRTVGTTVTKYVYGLGLISEETNNTVKVYHFDYRGSTVSVTDSNGATTDAFEYDTYGKIVSRVGNSDIIFCYNGRDGAVTDTNGLFYMRARYYSPDMRRFVNADIIAGEISEAVTLNRYAYANGNPVSNIDPFGLSSERSNNEVSGFEEFFSDIFSVFTSFYDGLKDRSEELVTDFSLYTFTNWISLGLVESVSDGLKSRAQKMLTNPNFDTISNWSTLGVYDSIKPIIIIGHDVGEIIKNNITIDGGFGIGLGGSIGDFKLGAESVFRMDVIGFQFSEGKLKFGHFGRSAATITLLGFVIGPQSTTYEPFNGSTKDRIVNEDTFFDWSPSIGSELFTVVGGHYSISISAKEIIEDLKEYFSEEYRK